MERPIRYVRENFVYGREFLHDADLDEQRERWLERANGRIHGTTGEVPRLRFEQQERHLLQRPAERPYHSLVVLPAQGETPKRAALPSVAVERRPLAAYAALAASAR